MQEYKKSIGNKAVELYSKLPTSTQTIVASSAVQLFGFSIFNNFSGFESRTSPSLPNVLQIITNTIKLAAIDGVVQNVAPYLPSLSAIKISCNDKFGEESFITKSAVFVENFSEYTESIDSKVAATIAIDLIACALTQNAAVFSVFDIATIIAYEFYKTYDATEIITSDDIIADL